MTSIEDALRLPDQFWIDIASTVDQCLCGCGQKFSEFDTEGRPRLFVAGHSSKGRRRSKESNKHLSEVMKGHSVSEQTRKRISQTRIRLKIPPWNKGLRGLQKASEESKEKMSQAKKGKKNPNYGKAFSEQRKRNISQAQIQFYLTDKGQETKKHLSQSLSGEKNYMFGRHRPKETKKQISESLIQFYLTDKGQETKKHLSESRKRYLESGGEARKKQISEATRRSWARRREAATANV